MKVESIITKRTGSYYHHSAIFHFRKEHIKEKIWFKSPILYSKSADPADSFFIVAYTLSLALNEDLEFDGVVSAKLLKNITKIKKYVGYPKNNVRVKTKGVVKRKIIGKKTGLFFTLGTDSFHALLCSNKINSDKRKFDCLVFIDGIEIEKVSKKAYRKIHKRIESVAKETKTKAIFLETNIRSVSDKIIHWELFHGAALAANGLLLSGVLRKIYISGCDDYMYYFPWGTGVKIDRMWSTEALSFFSADPTLFRHDKMRNISKSANKELFLENLWVCWKADLKNDIKNCSKCEKCLRTHLLLSVYGLKSPIRLFKRIDIKDLRKVNIPKGFEPSWNKIHKLLKKNPKINPEITKAVEHIIKKKRRKDMIKKLLPEFMHQRLVLI